MTQDLMTLDEFVQMHKLTAKSAKVHVKFLARAGKIPGAVKRMSRWYFDRQKVSQWNENR